jgi:cytochrome c biogenesis protein
MSDTELRTGVEVDEPLRLSTAPAPPPPRAAAAEPGSPAGRPGRPALRRVREATLRCWRQLTSMRTALLLLALLALAAIPGSVFPQTKSDPTDAAHYLSVHKTLGPILQRLGLFDVFASPWFAAIYLLLFVSLVGCLAPRIRLHARALRRQPPKAPRRLTALATATAWVADDSSAAGVIERAAASLRSRRWRVSVTEEGGGTVSLAAEKGYLRETGNLLFHVALLLMLVAVATSSLFGYKGQVLVVQGSGFADSPASYASFTPPRVGTSNLPPFSFTLNRFHATYTASNEPASFDAYVTYRATPTAPPRSFDLRVNHPLEVGGSSVYLINDGYAVDLTVRGAGGRVVHEHTPFLSDAGTTDISNSHGVVKIPDIGRTDLGLQGELFADYDPVRRTSVSPVAKHPMLSVAAYTGNLGLDSGVPQNDFVLDTAKLRFAGAQLIGPGQTFRLPNKDTITFDGVTPYAVFQVARDPGKIPALIAAGLILLGITLSLRIRRRRFWLRAVPAGDGDGTGSSVVQAAGLTRSDPDGFAQEFAGLVARCGGPADGIDGSESS